MASKPPIVDKPASTCPPERVYVGTDINLYFDSDHPLWHKRPDWFAEDDAG